MTLFRFVLLLVLVSVLFFQGCVSPGDVDVDDVQRLQQAMLKHSPQDRPAEGLGLMRPTTPEIPAVPVEKGLDGRPVIKLGLQQAIMIALASNTDIAIVAYNPQITREQMVEAAAAFDYTMFGSYEYTSTDLATADRGGTAPGIQKSNFMEFGLRQHTITGADWQIANNFSRTWDDATTDSANRWYQQNLALSVTQPLLRGAWPEYNLSALKIARLNHKITMSQFRGQVEETATTIMSAYYSLIQARRNVAIVEELMQVTRKTYEQVVGRSQIDATKVQIKQALAAVLNREAVLIEVKKIARDAQDRLVRLLGDSQINLLQDFDLVPTTEMNCLPVQIDVADQLLTALRLSPLLEQARYAIQQADINVKVAQNELLPTLNFTGGVTLNGGSTNGRGQVWHDVYDGRYTSYQAGLEFEYPIGNRAAEARLSQNRLQRLQQITQMQNTADQLAEAIRERIRQIQARHEEYLVQVKNLEATRQQLQALDDLEKIRGQLTPEFLNLKLNAQAQVASAEQSLIQAMVLYNTGMLDLSRLTGSVLEMQQIKLAMSVDSGPSAVPLNVPRPQIDEPMVPKADVNKPADPKPDTVAPDASKPKVNEPIIVEPDVIPAAPETRVDQPAPAEAEKTVEPVTEPEPEPVLEPAAETEEQPAAAPTTQEVWEPKLNPQTTTP